jgi:hypothetical protein
MREATMVSSPHSITALLLDWSNGNKESLVKLVCTPESFKDFTHRCHILAVWAVSSL